MAASPKRAPRDEAIIEKARAKWESSGLSDEQAHTLGLRALNAIEVSRLGSNFKAAGGVLIPYFDLKGKQTEFYRVRYLEPLPGFAGLVEKPQRYVQQAKTINEVYLPPLLPASWEEIAKDVNVTIYITEGEFKAASAAAHGLACVGLGGVDVWRATKRGVVLLPQLAAIEWKNRNVVIVYDSDAASNPNVVRAQRQLAKELVNRGSLPAVASLPPAKDGSKQGLDDLIVNEGPEALVKILETAPYFPEADALWEMNEEVLYVKDPGLVIVQESGQRLDPGKFTAHHYSHRHYVETQETKAGGIVFKKRPLARRWLDWERRFEVERITYAPGQTKLFENQYNAWPGWAVEPKKGEVGPFLWLIDFLFKSDPQWKHWFMQWMAYPIQHPGEKMYSAALLWGRGQGTGKSFVFYSLGGIYGKNFTEIKSKHLQGGFNAWAKNRQFVYGDEIAANDARIDSEELKGMITQPEVHINEKFLPEYVVPDCINYGFTSQIPDALFMDDLDRRYFVHEVVGQPAEKAFYDQMHKWLHAHGPPGSYLGDGAAALFHYLLRYDLKGFDPRGHAPLTTAKKRMINTSKSDLAMWCVTLKEDPPTVLKPLGERAARECEVFTPSQILHAYDPEKANRKLTPNGMAREMYRSGFRQLNGVSPIRCKAGLMRLYAIKNNERWQLAQPKEIAAHFDRYFGPDAGRF